MSYSLRNTAVYVDQTAAVAGPAGPQTFNQSLVAIVITVASLSRIA